MGAVEVATREFGRGGEAKLAQDLTLTRPQASRADEAAEPVRQNQQRAGVEGLQDRLQRCSPHPPRSILWHRLALESLQQEVKHRADHDQQHQRSNRARPF